MNDIIVEALTKYIRSQSEAAALDHETIASKLRAYRETDPNFEKAISEFADAEAAHEDPVEGRIVAAPNSLQTKIRSLLADA